MPPLTSFGKGVKVTKLFPSYRNNVHSAPLLSSNTPRNNVVLPPLAGKLIRYVRLKDVASGRGNDVWSGRWDPSVWYSKRATRENNGKFECRALCSISRFCCLPFPRYSQRASARVIGIAKSPELCGPTPTPTPARLSLDVAARNRINYPNYPTSS